MNKHTRYGFVVAFLVASLAISATWALVVVQRWCLGPPLYNYQGRLTDNTPQQNPISGSVNMEFRIYGSLTSSDLKWSESWTGVNVVDGLFSILLGSNTTINSTVFTQAAQDRFLEIRVNGQTLTPRQRIASVGYSTQSFNSQELGGLGQAGWQKVITANCPAGESIRSIAANGMSVTCEVDDGITTETDPQVGTLGVGHVPVWNGSELAPGAIVDGGSAVSIGVSTVIGGHGSIAGNLDVAGDSVVLGDNDVAGNLTAGGNFAVALDAGIGGTATIGANLVVAGNVNATGTVTTADVIATNSLDAAGTSFTYNSGLDMLKLSKKVQTGQGVESHHGWNYSHFAAMRLYPWINSASDNRYSYIRFNHLLPNDIDSTSATLKILFMVDSADSFIKFATWISADTIGAAVGTWNIRTNSETTNVNCSDPTKIYEVTKSFTDTDFVSDRLLGVGLESRSVNTGVNMYLLGAYIEYSTDDEAGVNERVYISPHQMNFSDAL